MPRRATVNEKPTDPQNEPSKGEKAEPVDPGLQAQIDDAKEQGAGKISVPLGETTTANDSGASSV